MADLVTIAIAVLALFLILKITAKLIKIVLFLAVVGVVFYVLANFGFLAGLM